jgi:hypothetical protein
LDFTREPRRPDFYLISGFLMAMILNGKYADTPHGNWLFYTNRAVKIFAPCYAIRHKQTAQIAVTLFAYIAEPVLATRMLFRHNSDQGREVAP